MIARKILAAGAVLSVLSVGATAAVASATPTSKTFAIKALGANEMGKGDSMSSAFATGTITVNTLKHDVCYEITTHDLKNITMSHIHLGKKGAEGNVVATLNVMDFNLKAMGHACVTVPAAVAKQIFANPTGYYFNVHTTLNAGGAVRGQMVRAN